MPDGWCARLRPKPAPLEKLGRKERLPKKRPPRRLKLAARHPHPSRKPRLLKRPMTLSTRPPQTAIRILVWPGVLASPGVLINGESADVAGANCYWEAFYATCESVPIPIGGHVGFKLGPYPAPDGPGYVYDLCY